MNDPRPWMLLADIRDLLVDVAKALTICVCLYFLFACGGHGQDNKQGTTVANDKDKQEQAK